MVADGSTVDATDDSDTALENTELPALFEGNLLQMQRAFARWCGRASPTASYVLGGEPRSGYHGERKKAPN